MRKIMILSALLALLLVVGACPASAEEPRTVQAATVDELLEAIAPDTVIELTGRSYNLTEAAGYGDADSEYYHWNDIYDGGWELEIAHADGLTIRAARPGTEIVTLPRYACVLKFTDCASLTLEGFTAGHVDGPGYCTGSVIFLDGCRETRIEGCELYGCGTFGVEAQNCRDVQVRGTTIRDCSYGAVSATTSSGILLDGCMVYGIQGYNGVFFYNACRACALLNTVVRSCSSPCLLELYSARDFCMAGCEVSGNSFEGGMFAFTPYPARVEGCAFRNNGAAGWYYESWETSARAVDAEGREYSDAELASMALVTDAVWELPEDRIPDTPAPAPDENGVIHVRNVDELLASLAPGAHIRLEDGVYDLSEATGYGSYSTDSYYWMACYDGPGLVIRGCDGLRIEAAGPHRARITAVPRYCEVLSFENCSGLSLSGFSAGHSPKVEGPCAGGVVSLTACSGVLAEDLSLFGCGVLGVTAFNTDTVVVRHSEIWDCSDGAFCFFNSRDIRVEGCNLHDNGGPSYQVYDCEGVTADGAGLPEGATA